MDANELKQRIQSLSIWKRGEQRAPHKPLLILYALGRLQNGCDRYLNYHEVREKLTMLLKEFGPIRKSYHPEEPFVRLVRDGIWELNADLSAIKISDKWLLTNEIIGGFNDKAFELLSVDKSLVYHIANTVLNEHFPETIHEDILTAVGLNLEYSSRKVRDPKFRDKILKAYEYSCAVCGFNVRLGHKLVAIEAAHIKWHQAGGPDLEENGIALCSMHHKLFDRGVFTINDSRKILVSEEAHGVGFEEWLYRYHGQIVRNPIHPEYQPKESYIHWHLREVFRGPGRYHVG